MAASPPYKVFNPQGEYVASCKYGEDAAAVVSCYGDGAKIRHRDRMGRVLWHEGAESFPAAESYDMVAATIAKRHALIL